MPHKHRRDKSKSEPSHDLPPSTIARPLPILKTTTQPGKLYTAKSHRSRKPRSKRSGLGDDAPRTFTRLMNYQATGRKPPKGLDDGAPASKKRKHNADANTTARTSIELGAVIPAILHGEPLSAFSARVDAAIPVSGLAKSRRSSTAELGLRRRQTKMEKRMQRMQAEWREAAAKRKEKLAEQEEEAEAGKDEVNADGVGRIGSIYGNERAGKKIKCKGKSKRRKVLTASNENDDIGDDDPWVVIAAKRLENSSTTPSEPRSGGLVGLHDVVLAPPKLLKLPKEKNITVNIDVECTRYVKGPSKKNLTIGL